jgi:Mce-associated membrane protein
MNNNDTASGDSTEPASKAAARRRASRAAGPASGAVGLAPTAVKVEQPATVKVRVARPAGPPPRRRPYAKLVAIVGLGVCAVLVAALAGVATLLMTQQRHAEAAQAREQRFVDTASQTVINMFSGPLRDMMSQAGNVDNLKAIFRDTQATSEAVVNGAALEKIDEVADNAAVLVSVRVTVTDLDGVNKPSQPYRLRVVVHEDDNGHMTGYDLKYPDGGN